MDNILINTHKNILNIKKKISMLPSNYIDIIKRVVFLFKRDGIDVYLVGGMVRDIILNRKSKDMDFVIDYNICENNYREKIYTLTKELNGKSKFNSRFKTANINLKTGLNLDFAVTRKEHYPYPGSLPEVKVSKLKEDLFRRDFTINTFILNIDQDNWGIVEDYLGAEKDLKDKLIRALHRFSFIDDPTRIIRGVRQAVELDFIIEKETKILMKDALKDKSFPSLKHERVMKELKLLFQNKINKKMINLLKEIPIFNLLNFNINLNRKVVNDLFRLEDILAYFVEKNYNIKSWLLRLKVIINGSHINKLLHYNINNYDKDILTFSRQNKYTEIIKNSSNSVTLANTLANLELEKIILIMIEDNSTISSIKYYFEKINDINLLIDGNDLIELGIEPGPVIKNVLERVWQAKVNGKLKNREQEIKYAAHLIKETERS